MRKGPSVSLFPFLSVLLSTMGILSFLAITFLLLSRQEAQEAAAKTPVEVRWVGAPSYVRPVMLECRENGVTVRPGAGMERAFYPAKALEGEVERVRSMERQALSRLGRNAEKFQVWLVMKSLIQNDPALQGSFTFRAHQLEMANLRWERARELSYYPILLIYPDGVKCWEMASFLVETTTRLNIGLEPMLNGWEVPYQNLSAQRP